VVLSPASPPGSKQSDKMFLQPHSFHQGYGVVPLLARSNMWMAYFFFLISLLPSLSIPSKFQPAKWEGWFTMRQGFPSSTCISPQDEEGTCHCGGTAVAITPGFPASSNPAD